MKAAAFWSNSIWMSMYSSGNPLTRILERSRPWLDRADLAPSAWAEGTIAPRAFVQCSNLTFEERALSQNVSTDSISVGNRKNRF